MKYLLLIIMLFIACKKEEKADDIESLLEQNEEVLKKTTICSCGKSMEMLLSIDGDKISEPSDLKETVGLWDTSYTEIAVAKCSSLVYVCENKFVSFHFGLDDMKFIGHSYGEISDGQYINTAHLININGE